MNSPARIRYCVHLACGKPILCRRLCQTHYRQLRRGIPLPGIPKQYREKNLSRSELDNFDYEDYWRWVKTELKIQM